MNEEPKIIHTPSCKELLDQLRALESFDTLFRVVPFAKRLFSGIDKAFESFAELKEQAELLQLPDKFNDVFAKLGWIAYESLSVEVMKQAIILCETVGIDIAEEYLASSYDKDTIEFGVMRFNGHADFRRRIRLAQLAKDDYLAERYHACIPLLLCLLDGLVNDVSKHVGFFAENTDLTAWDCIAAHETGLQSLTQLMTKGRTKTNEEPIRVPYRHGILHGRELAFDNQIVAAKCWAAIFAARDWASVIASRGKAPVEKTETSWSDLLASLAENARVRKELDSWMPRAADDVEHLPHKGNPEALPDRSPEREVARFLENWCRRRFGLLAEGLLDFSNDSLGKKAGRASEDFGRHVPTEYSIESVSDEAPAISEVVVTLTFGAEENPVIHEVSVRATYEGEDHTPLMRSDCSGRWKILQNSFAKILYGWA
ncbi:hypothetical protein GC176_18605 [bacterium]|nr:hypothetical protein [bacterium]